MLAVFGGVGFILWIGRQRCAHRPPLGRQPLAFVFYSAVAAGSVAAVSEVLGELQRAAGATERLVELLEAQPGIVAPREPAPPPQEVRSLEFDAVSFAYPSRPGTLRSRSSRCASCRASASRWSALPAPASRRCSRCSLRFYDPQVGSVRIDGIRRAQHGSDRAARARRRRAAGSGDLRDERARKRSLRASRRRRWTKCGARASRPTRSNSSSGLPQTFDTQLGERGVTLSGGQRNGCRSRARCSPTGRSCCSTKRRARSTPRANGWCSRRSTALARGRTTLVIAHRLATVQHANRIVVLDRGAIVAEGTHQELMRQGGLYANLATLQFLDSGSAG
jgi:ATP-binding cassette subfamily B protein